MIGAVQCIVQTLQLAYSFSIVPPNEHRLLLGIIKNKARLIDLPKPLFYSFKSRLLHSY